MSVLWRFLLVLGGVSWFLNQVPFPQLTCSIPKGTCFVRYLRVDPEDPVLMKLSSKEKFFPKKYIPEDQLLPQWDKMEYREPDFMVP
ncbi:MAG: hypothetical protein LW808_001095 [Verrucomicrobiota bacterium]|nr:MAG: hypothetical protein LW808_001095 [Verrucomicrobiota bacterium]